MLLVLPLPRPPLTATQLRAAAIGGATTIDSSSTLVCVCALFCCAGRPDARAARAAPRGAAGLDDRRGDRQQPVAAQGHPRFSRLPCSQAWARHRRCPTGPTASVPSPPAFQHSSPAPRPANEKRLYIQQTIGVPQPSKRRQKGPQTLQTMGGPRPCRPSLSCRCRPRSALPAA
eukprot:364444-Chlamydomonas_euryale.AAC.20